MTKWYIGVDGGGTKTAAAISLEDGTLCWTAKRSGCSYQAVGIEAAALTVAESVMECLASAGARLDECAMCCLGIPCYGENAEQDAAMAAELERLLAPAPLYLVNDVEVGWAGALDCGPGIHIVAGTGAIAFGKNGKGETARCGGWDEFFVDEGSAYWIGREAMSLFTKQADGRLPRGPLYGIVKKQFALPEDMDFIKLVRGQIAPHRDQVASFQRIALEAARAGDEIVIHLYERAAHELALMAGALKRELRLPRPVHVSYSGGVFHADDFILKPLAEKLADCGGILQAPVKSPLEGALALAIQHHKQKEGV